LSGDALHYRSAGVDLRASDDAMARIARLVASTRTAGSVGGFGGFGGMFRVPADMRSPVLVSSADGVGTKIKVAIESGRNDSVGHDLVNHCVNDILVQGARPLFFLDYVAFGKLEPIVLEAIVSGVAAGCRENECSLIGGETAEMPGLYAPPDYDLAGFITGCVEEDSILGSARVDRDDVLIGFESTGLHTNGYSLARKIIAERLKLKWDDPFPELEVSAADVMLSVHRSYYRALSPVFHLIHAMAHITGGGIPGNLNRALPGTLDAVVDAGSWEIPTVFTVLESAGRVPREEMYRVFNMGVGMIAVAPRGHADEIIGTARIAGVVGWVMGSLRSGAGEVVIG
jgi:phosphoribosylformylglycinamidine cyclo-ligase